MFRIPFSTLARWTQRAAGPLVIWFLLVAPAQAFVNNGLFLDLLDEPDIATTGITMSYDADAVDANTGRLTAMGYATTIFSGAIDHDFDFPPGFGEFSLEALIDNSTGNALGGSLSIGGMVSDLGFNSGTLLTGTLAGFGTADNSIPNGPMEFLFNNLGGDAASLYAGSAGVLLAGTTAMPAGSPSVVFANDFTNSGPFAKADTAAVPEPPAFALILTAGLLLYGRCRQGCGSSR